MSVGLSLNYRIVRFFYLFLFVILSSGCGPSDESGNVDYSCSKRASTIYNGNPESSVCTTTTAYPGGVTITGTSVFQKRPYNGGGLGAITTSNIRFAEFVVYNSSNQAVQCGSTSSTGTFSFDLPQVSADFKIRINTRGQNTTINASVLNCPEENKPYYVETTFQPDNSKDIGIVTADSDSTGSMVGAAFNIFDQFVSANIFLKNELQNCSASEAGCTDFTVAPKLQAYWTKGFTPNVYFGSNSPISFYLPGYSRLFILGGVSGDVYTSDTDHFDDSVILHEYGHFLEDLYTDTDSPGGSHSGNSIIDPRLAWGEGWGNFIQAAIRNDPTYRDTLGTPSGSSASSYIFNIPLEAPNGACVVGSITPGCDIPQFAGEGVFREFSVARMLWDVFDTVVDGESVQNELVRLWASLTLTTGFKNNNAEFRNVGFLHYIQSQVLSTPDSWSALRTIHSHTDDSSEYAQYVAPTVPPTVGCGKVLSMTPYDDPSDNGSFATSHRLRNNNFYHYYNPSRRNVTFTVKVQTVDAGPGVEQEPDVDLYLYNRSARYGNSADIIRSADNYWDNNSSTDQTETFTAANLAQGHYLINTKIFTGRVSVNQCFGICAGGNVSASDCICQNDMVPAGDEIIYELEANGADLCPTDVP